MGLFSKLKKLDPARKLVSKTVKDPIGKKLLGTSSSKKPGKFASTAAKALGPKMGGAGQATPKPAQRKMSDLAGTKPTRRGRFNP